jgi:hypothetical protein
VGAIHIYDIHKNSFPRSSKKTLAPRTSSQLQELKIFILLDFHPISKPPDLPLALVPMKFQLLSVVSKKWVITASSPNVSCRKMISGWFNSTNLWRADFLEGLATPLQFRERIFMSYPLPGVEML